MVLFERTALTELAAGEAVAIMAGVSDWPTPLVPNGSYTVVFQNDGV